MGLCRSNREFRLWSRGVVCFAFPSGWSCLLVRGHLLEFPPPIHPHRAWIVSVVNTRIFYIHASAPGMDSNGHQCNKFERKQRCGKLVSESMHRTRETQINQLNAECRYREDVNVNNNRTAAVVWIKTNGNERMNDFYFIYLFFIGSSSASLFIFFNFYFMNGRSSSLTSVYGRVWLGCSCCSCVDREKEQEWKDKWFFILFIC